MQNMESKKPKKTRGVRRQGKLASVPFTKVNYWLFGASALVLLVGYLTLRQPPVDGFLSLTLAPVLLVIGYCILIPVAILYAGKGNAQEHK